MGKFLKFSTTCIALILLLGSVSNASALDDPKMNANPNKIVDKTMGTVLSSETNKTTNITEKKIIITDKDEILRYAKERNIKSPEKIKEIVTYSKINNDVNTPEIKSTMQKDNITAFAAYSVKQYGSAVTMIGTDEIRRYDMPGPIRFVKEFTVQVSSSFNANVGISADVVNLGLGVNVSSTYSEKETIDSAIPAGEEWSFRYYPLWKRYYFEVYNGSSYVGSGRADIALGYKLDIVKYKI